MQIFLTILVLVLMLGILISTHELGHLVMAKCFNVYCLEYSIGFGPRLFHTKRKGGETEFSIRAFPLGGFVSMYGEGVELPDGVEVPPERGLEAQKPWKKSLIMLAGVTVNFTFCILFTLIYTVAFQSFYEQAIFETGYTDTTGNALVGYSMWGEDSELGGLSFSRDNDRYYSPFGFSFKGSTYFVVDSDAKLDGREYVACYKSAGLGTYDVINNLVFFETKDSFYVSDVRQKMSLVNYPDFTKEIVKVSKESQTLELDLEVMHVNNGGLVQPSEEMFKNRTKQSFTLTSIKDGDKFKWDVSEKSPKVRTYYFYPSFGERLQGACAYYVSFYRAIGEGLASIFTFNFSNLGSIVAFGGVLSTASASVGWGRTFFLYGGLLSLNLAILNLLPFPGLDGWQLLVVGVEKVAKKKIPDKVKSIVSAIGVIALLIFGISLIVRDVIVLFI
ncbi:MAG: site-2 protease family protein [Bacilli bacterium]|nr:site-2 protease family protein [Bacilli bacterium]